MKKKRPNAWPKPKQQGRRSRKRKKAPKPKRVSLLKGMAAEDVDLTLALRLLSLPRRLGHHPEDGKVVNASVGRFGPYVVHDGVFASIKPPDDVLEIGLDRGLGAIGRKEGKRWPRQQCQRPQRTGRAPRRRQGASAGWALWSLCEVQAHQRYAAKGDQARSRNDGAGNSAHQ